jgi:hypothetical protein
VIRDPQSEGQVVNEIVSTQNISATIRDWVGIKTTDKVGESLFETIQTPETGKNTARASAQGLYEDEGRRLFSIRDDEYKWILKRTIDSNEIVLEQLFSLEDGNETRVASHNIDYSRVNSLLSKLQIRSRDLVSKMDNAPDEFQEVNEEISARLEALGYK